MGKLREAEENASKALSINPSATRGYFILGSIFEQKQEFQKAVENFQTFVTKGHPDSSMIDEATMKIASLKHRCTHKIC